MNKSDLARILAEKSHINKRKADVIVDLIFDSMADALKGDERIEIRGFGSFVSRRYNPYTGRNPKTGASIEIPAKRLPFFKVGKELKKRVNNSSGGSSE